MPEQPDAMHTESGTSASTSRIRRGGWRLCLFWLPQAVGLPALVWFLIRVIPKPSRAAYPCQRAAFPVACASHVRGLMLATQMYAQQYGQWMPPGPREIAPDGAFANDPDRGMPLELFCAARIGVPDLSSQNGWYGQGLLWQQGLLTDGRFYYCPEMERLGAGSALYWPQNMAAAPDRAGAKASVWQLCLPRRLCQRRRDGGGAAQCCAGTGGGAGDWRYAVSGIDVPSGGLCGGVCGRAGGVSQFCDAAGDGVGGGAVLECRRRSS